MRTLKRVSKNSKILEKRVCFLTPEIVILVSSIIVTAEIKIKKGIHNSTMHYLLV